MRPVATGRLLTLVRVLTSGCGLFALFGAAATAQTRDNGDDFWLGVGSGYGVGNFYCHTYLCGAFSGRGGMTAAVLIRWARHRTLRWGVEGNLWPTSTDQLSNVSLVASYYVDSTSNFFLKAGAGLAHHSSRGGGLGLLGGLGRDVRLGARASLTPMATVRYGLMAVVPAHYSGGVPNPDDRPSQLVGEVGIDISFGGGK